MSHQSEWVEVIGLPGCGKTTLIRKNLASLKSHYRIIESRQPTLRSRIRARLLYESRFKKSGLPQALARKLSYRLSFRPLSNGSGPVFFFDSGVLQVALEYLVENNFAEQDVLPGRLPELAVAGKLVYMHDEIETIIERELQRPDRRYPALNREALLHRYKVADELIRERFLPLADKVYPVNLATETDLLRVLEK